MSQEMTTYRSQVNGLVFDSLNPTTNMLLGNHNKSQFVQPERTETAVKTKGRKAKISLGAESEMEIM